MKASCNESDGSGDSSSGFALDGLQHVLHATRNRFDGLDGHDNEGVCCMVLCQREVSAKIMAHAVATDVKIAHLQRTTQLPRLSVENST